ncbi:hypothetical protein BRD00_07720 [Halobacteriales archaeon QS_8_69_26]|nr:MAG: hypothetical protein BRD00_07720 [Halobacteriales archaeon QS_8_69_26]
MVDIEAAAKYPMEDDDWIKTVGIGGIFIFLNFLIGTIGAFVVFLLGAITLGIGFLLFIPLFLIQIVLGLPIMGYGLRVLRTTIEGKDMPPKFGDWGSLFKEGAYGYGIGLVYVLPFIVLGGGVFAVTVVLGLVAGAATDGGGATSLLISLGQLAFGLVALVWYPVAGYLMPISLSVYATEGDVRAAFSRDRLKRVATNKEYAVPWVVAIAGMLVANNVASFLTFLVIGAPIQFYVIMVAFRLFGEGYAAAMESEEATPVGAPAETPR